MCLNYVLWNYAQVEHTRLTKKTKFKYLNIFPQIFSLLGSAYSDCSAAAFALFKFVQSTGAALAFYYSGAASLHVQV